MDAEIVVEIFGHEIVDVRTDSGTDVGLEAAVLVVNLLLPHIVGPQLGLGLTFEVRLLNLDADGSHYALTAVCRFVIFLEELLEGLGYGFAVGCQMGTSVTGVLTVHEGRNVLAVGVAVAEHDFDVLTFEVNGWIEGFLAQVFVHQVKKAVFRFVGNAVEDQREAFLEVGVVLDHSLDIVEIEGEVVEHHRVRGEPDQRAVLLLCWLLTAVLELSALETCPGTFSVPV